MDIERLKAEWLRLLDDVWDPEALIDRFLATETGRKIKQWDLDKGTLIDRPETIKDVLEGIK